MDRLRQRRREEGGVEGGGAEIQEENEKDDLAPSLISFSGLKSMVPDDSDGRGRGGGVGPSDEPFRGARGRG